ncbi:DNA polymerase III subunit beta [Clostridium sp. D2Q-14]|uniref:DNA polymerase III subunit beta n=1 Tax=Anaeromonas gelatinilytica TaxID=2683194 RepID=UPI00193C62CB|nr:DNA polymerase III subunit beta [Anaeromonas gelatinilytica]MBS4534945.1 DNA polymerase III subunit beta [Anaeromonas gelatinilytica]
MKIRIPQKNLSKHINIVQKGISSKTTLPILDGILIEAYDNYLKLTGTDLELGIETKIKCEIIEEGKIVIPSRIFGDIIKKLPNNDINLETDLDYNIHIVCDNSEFNILGNSADEYPELPEINDEKSFKIPKDLLKNMIRQTVFATAQDETRPILTGALLEVKNNNATLVALDGYRLALKNSSISYDSDIKVVIPGKTLNEVNRILDDEDNNIKIMFTSSHILFNLGDTIINSRLLEGQFLNYKDIIRNEYKSQVIVKTNDIKESIERASLLAREGKNNLVKFDIKDDKMVITSNSEIGNVHEDVNIELEGEDIVIAFNSKYILEGLKVIDSDEVIMNFISNVNPCIMKPKEDENYTYLILPVRLAEAN